MKKTLGPVSDTRSESLELTRRYSRAISEAVQQLDESRAHAKSCSDLFSIQTEVLRVKLRENAERLIFCSPVNFGRKSEELLWRKGFYDDVSTAKRLRRNSQWTPEEQHLVRSHLNAGVGFYHHMLLRLEGEYRLDFTGCVDFPMVSPDFDSSKNKAILSKKAIEWANEAAYRCLVYLGDLSRYLLDLSPHWNYSLPERYYYQALTLNPDAGMPHNQMGTLSDRSNLSLNKAYHYMRCIMCPQPFDGAEGNLIRIMEKNAVWLNNSEDCSKMEQSTSEPRQQIQLFVAHFLVLVDVWFFDKPNSSQMSELCYVTLKELHCCLNIDPCNEDNTDFCTDSSIKSSDTPSYLTQDIMFKAVVMALMCLSKLRQKGSTQTSAVVAFLIAVLSLLMQQVLQHFEDSVFNLSVTSECHEKGDNDKRQSSVHTHSAEDTNGLNGLVIEKNVLNGNRIPTDIVKNGNIVEEEEARKGKKQRQKICRRRLRKDGDGSSEDSEHTDSEDLYNAAGSASDISEDDEVLLDLSSDEEDGDDLNTRSFGELKISNCRRVEDRTDSIRTVKESLNGKMPRKKKTLDPADVMEIVADEQLLPVIKVCLDWLRGDIAVVRACCQNSREMLIDLITLVNQININVNDLQKSPDASCYLHNQNIVDNAQKIPLPEDVMLRNLTILKTSQDCLSWEWLRRNRLNAKEEALIRVKKLVNFCSYLETFSEIGIKYEPESFRFTVSPSEKKPKCTTQSTSVPNTVGPSLDPDRRDQLMQNMGQLWLRAEVQDLESRIEQGSDVGSFSPYLVLDVDSLTTHYVLVQQLLSSKKFIIIVPSVVLSALDQLKRESLPAREAIRWLEFQFQKGNRFLRPQRSSEALHLPLVAYPKRKDREAWVLFQVLECCNYLNRSNSSRNSCHDTPIVTLLTGQHGNGNSTPASIGIAKSVGVNLEHIESFFTKWRNSSKSHG